MGVYICAITMKNGMDVPQKTKNRTTIWSRNPTPGIYGEKTQIQKDTHTPMFTAALFTTAKTWKKTKMVIKRGMNRDIFIYIIKLNIYKMEYYSSIKRMK